MASQWIAATIRLIASVCVTNGKSPVCDASAGSCQATSGAGAARVVVLDEGVDSGIVHRPWPTGITIDSVVSGSWASQHGIRDHDVISEVDGVPISSHSADSFAAALSKRPLALTVFSGPEAEEVGFAAARERAEARGGCYITGGGDLPWSPRRMRLRAAYDLCRTEDACRGITAHVGGLPNFEKTYEVHFKNKYDCSKGAEWFTLAASNADEDAWHVVRDSAPWVPPDLSSLLRLPNATLLSEDPMVLQIDGFLSDAEIDHVIQLAEPRLETSTTTMERIVDQRRTSKTAWLSEPEHYEDPVLDGIDERIASITGIPRINMEYMQVLHYGKTEFYTGHSDFIPEHLQSPCGARIGTFFMYLSDVVQGGETKFPNLNLEVKPVKGRAVLWWNVMVSHWQEFGLQGAEKALQDDRLFHTALPVEDGVKWAVNRWLHQSNFVDNHRLGLLG